MFHEESITSIVAPKPNSTVMVFDVPAVESGALSILNDYYNEVLNYHDKSINWIFIVSTPWLSENKNIQIVRLPWIKKSFLHRMYFDLVKSHKIINYYNPDIIVSFQNKGLECKDIKQIVYLQLAFVLSDHDFTIKNDGFRIWFYQKIYKYFIFHSLRNVQSVIVQTQWMKTALIEKARIPASNIYVVQPKIDCTDIKQFIDTKESRRTFFYPATAFSYKNHMTLLKALCFAQNHGLKEYVVYLTIEKNENKVAEEIYDFVLKNRLNVKFIGKISRNDVFIMYSKSILLFPSFVESFGLPLLEAKLSNTYVVASDYPFSREILKGYEKARFFSELNYEEMGLILLEINEKV